MANIYKKRPKYKRTNLKNAFLKEKSSVFSSNHSDSYKILFLVTCHSTTVVTLLKKNESHSCADYI